MFGCQGFAESACSPLAARIVCIWLGVNDLHFTSGLVSNLLPYRDDSNRKEYREIKILGIVQYINCIIFASN